MIASGNHIGQIKQSLATPPGASPYASSAHVTEAQKEEFEKSLDAPDADKKSGWDAANQKQFGLSIFQMEHGRSMAHDTKMKEIYDSMNDSGKSKSHHRQG